IMEEGTELLTRLKKALVDKDPDVALPMFTSCSPGWVKYLEHSSNNLLPNLSTCKSPQQMFGALAKTYYAQKNNIDPSKIVSVSIMPCVAKKYEITQSKLKINGLLPVDYVLTTRELAYLLIKHQIDLKKIAPEKLDDPLGIPSGAGVIYGASGGVMESALRTAYARLTGKNLTKFNLVKMRGMEGVKKAQVKIKNKVIKVVTVDGIGNAKLILEELKKDPRRYDYVEVMACPGGCIGGGGQPVPTDPEIRQARAKGLYQIDRHKKIRLAHENPIVKQIYHEYFTQQSKINRICHTKYSRKEREGYKILTSKKTH
ncbi:MAG: iron hydrogenase small subunit, partial [Candidatus Aenigmarchaeota archaeon]|nr:iron hydrogenase small subunit [Candidatus Aenigmarchaeota archaeon]